MMKGHGGQSALARIVRGVRDHFPQRAAEWLMLYASLAMGFVLAAQEDVFDLSPSFTTMGRWAPEEVWACLVLICGALRSVALVINGTFETFTFSPHLRAVASAIGMLFWSSFCLAFLNAAVFEGGSGTAPAAYSVLVLAELINTYRAWEEMGRSRARR